MIRRGLLGGAVLATAGGSWLAFKPTRMVPLPAQPLQVLDQRSYSILHAVTGRVLTDPVSSPEAKAEVPLRIDAELARADAASAKDFVRVLGLLENALAGFVLDFRGKPFTRLDPEDQDDVLDAWRTSMWAVRRSGYQAIKQLITTHYYINPVTYAATGYPGPPSHLLP